MWLEAIDIGTFLQHHPIAMLTVLFALVSLRGWVGKSNPQWLTAGSIAWLYGLSFLCIWIIQPLTADRIVISVAIFITGLVLLIIYQRKRDFASKKQHRAGKE